MEPTRGRDVRLVRINKVLTVHAPDIMIYRFKLLLNDETEAEGDSYSAILTTGVERGVLALPGTAFLPNGRKSAYVRASFSLTSDEDVDEALKRLREAILAARAPKVT
jgi:tryptophan aminotransferase